MAAEARHMEWRRSRQNLPEDTNVCFKVWVTQNLNSKLPPTKSPKTTTYGNPSWKISASVWFFSSKGDGWGGMSKSILFYDLFSVKCLDIFHEGWGLPDSKQLEEPFCLSLDMF